MCTGTEVAKRAPRADPVRVAISAMLAVAVSRVVLFPIDTFKTLLQSSASVGGRVGGLDVPPWRVVLDVVRKRPFTIYHGLLPSILSSVPAQALYMTVYELTRAHLPGNQSDKAQDWSRVAISAAAGNAVAALARVPAERIKQKMQVDPSATLLSAVTQSWRREGLRGIYRGFGAQIIRDVPYAVVLYVTYEHLRTRQIEMQLQRVHLSPSAIAGLLASVSTNPLDVVKTRVMADGEPLRSAMRSVIQNPRLMLRGMVPRSLQKMPSSMIYLACYRLFMNLNLPASLTKVSARKRIHHRLRPQPHSQH
ncbi:putative S-adenosylmethionine carrier 2, chloroplastic [Porphyridium purpureum]|uniref:Putative S-adenosylmethionine carrier 2, chloroplastic n=1 Tax=Porphyridium purpureum TaxID=35688 RepID=A0A5J4Z401_PORPP|nr:putative S-adenosylmethionine carrier 2, chloroplastic [Porphyridium purpureum]|eukprot:POR1932..scf208_2